jgi:hypothetical protein
VTADGSQGVVFPEVDGVRSTSALGRGVVADALRAVDPVGARGAGDDTNWRRGYLVHFRRLVEAGLLSRDAALTIARDGLASLHARMRFVGPDGEVPVDHAVDEVIGTSAGEPLRTVTVTGSAAPQRDLTLPYRGERLRGDALLRQLDTWVERGIIESSCAEAVRLVAANPEWLDLSGTRVVVLGAGAEMGPLTALLRWGAEVVAVDLPRPEVWQRVLATAHRHGGTLRVPVSSDGSEADLDRRAGADVLHDLPRVAEWLAGLDGPMVLGNYVYADGATHVRVAMAVDALGTHLTARRSDVSLAFLATPTDVFAVPAAAVAEATRRYAQAGGVGRVRRPLRLLSAGRLLARNYAPDADPGINDSLVPQQGPNYALAKRLQRWRATVARDAGIPVSLRIAPATRTRSVVRNRLLAAAYSGAHRFGIEVFQPATSNTLMAAVLVHDLMTRPGPAAHPWQDEAHAAAHGGLWRQPYAPRSVLGIAVLLGLGGARN